MNLHSNNAFTGIRSTFLLILLLWSYCLSAQPSEYEIKAVAFEKLALFIQWPSEAFSSSNEEFTIGILGENPFGNLLKEIYSNHKIKNRKVKIIYLKNISQSMDCHLLFVSDFSKGSITKLAEKIKDKPILLIGDSENDAENGCYISFYMGNGKLRFKINQKAMKAAGFSVDYKLLQIAEIVNTGDG